MMPVTRAVRTGLPPLPTLSEIVKLYNLKARKKLSQNFLLDMNICRKIVKKAGPLDGCHVCEVGPGPGGLTRAILDNNVASLTVIEKDFRFMPGLKLLSAKANCPMTVIKGDVLEYDFSTLWPALDHLTHRWSDPPPPFVVIGNLPFSVATPLVVRWLCAMSERTGPFKFGRTRLLLTFQMEVAQRLVADIETPQRCRLSVMCQYIADAKLRFGISGSAFVPPPDVDVGVVSLTPKAEPLTDLPFKVVEKFCRHLFHYRQKWARYGVRTLYPEHLQYLHEEAVAAVDLSLEYPCYAWTNEDVLSACRVYYGHCVQHPGLFYYDYRGKATYEQCQHMHNPAPPPILICD